MTSSSNINRIWSLDLLRGFFLMLMLIAHSIFFFHTRSHPLLVSLNTLGDLFSFSGLLLISGAAGYVAYIHYQHPTHDVIRRISKRLFIYLLGYYLLVISASSLSEGLSLRNTWELLTFQKLFPFTEFIVTLILFGFLKIPLRSLYDKIARSWLVVLLIIILTYTLGIIGHSTSFYFLPSSWKAILFGQSGLYSFPLFYYAPLYLVGIFVGRQFWIHQSDRKLSRSLLSLSFSCLLLLIALIFFSISNQLDINSILNRWPPAPGFILTGIVFSTFILALFVYKHDLINLPITRTILLIFGQNAFAIYFSHTFLLYLFKALQFPQAHSAVLVAVLTFISLVISLYMAKILPLNYAFTLTFINWCECKFGYCTHAQEHHLIKKIKSVLFNFFKLSNLLSFNIGVRKIKLINTKSSALAIGLLVLTTIPLGVAENDLYFKRTVNSISGELNRKWFLNSYQKNSLIYEINIPDQILIGQKNVAVVFDVDGQQFTAMEKNNNTWKAEVNLEPYLLGKHNIITTVDIGGNKYKTQPSVFFISAPMYVVWTIDWEGYDVSQDFLDSLDTIAYKHLVPITHLFNPRIYTTSEITVDRADYLAQWVKQRKELKNDEIGLHLHMFPDFVEKAGVEPKLEPTWGGGFTPGYDILTTAYTYQEMKKILEFSQELMQAKGLGTPRSYRAGAWFANIETLKALNDTGFLIDTSGRTSYDFGTNKIKGPWDLKTTTQPYFPSEVDQNSSYPPPLLNLLEVPNNGADDYAFSQEEMIQRFKDNYNGGFLEKPKQVTFLSHPQWFNQDRQKTMEDVFGHIDQFSFLNDQGPVVYATLLTIYHAWLEQ